MALQCSTPSAKATWMQRIRCKGGEHYRFDVCVTGHTQIARDHDPADPRNGRTSSSDGSMEPGGFIVSIQPMNGSRRVGPPVEWPTLGRLAAGTVLRNYVRCPDESDAVEIRIGLRHAVGCMHVHEVRAFKLIEPEVASHVLSTPPPPFADPPPIRAKTITVWADGHAHPELMKLLTVQFGARAVELPTPTSRRAGHLTADALLLPDADPPSAVRSFAALKRLAQERMVIISPPAFAKLAGAAVSVRRVEQEDDPIWAKVVCGNFMTRGFALLDAFPFARETESTGSFVQFQLRRSKLLREFCERHGLVTVLEGLADADVTSNQPICLYAQYESGALIVMDMEPIENGGSAGDRASLAGFLLLNALGIEQVSLGQFTVPATSEMAFREELVELGVRYPVLTVRSSYGPRASVRDHVIELGDNKATSFGLDLSPRRSIVIRTGLSGWDHDGIYGALLWIKQLLRSVPFECPYAQALISTYPIVWTPLCTAWRGWNVDLTGVSMTSDPSPDPGATSVAVAIDVVSCPRRSVRVQMAGKSPSIDRIRRWLSSLGKPLIDGGYVYRAADFGESTVAMDAGDWRRQALQPTAELDDTGFQTDYHQRLADEGADLIRIEVPSSPVDMTPSSIWRTDLVATLLETVVGLYYGLIVVNRTAGTMQLDLPESLRIQNEDLQSLVVDRGQWGPLKIRPQSGRLTFPPASCLVLPGSRMES